MKIEVVESIDDGGRILVNGQPWGPSLPWLSCQLVKGWLESVDEKDIMQFPAFRPMREVVAGSVADALLSETHEGRLKTGEALTWEECCTVLKHSCDRCEQCNHMWLFHHADMGEGCKVEGCECKNS